MDLNTFKSSFDTEKKCMDYLYNLRWKNSFCCPRCKHNEMWKVGEYKFKCKKCGYQSTVISGTLLHDTRIPIQQWFKAVWYESEQGNKATAAGLQKEIGLISNRTALSMHKKISLAKLRRVNAELQGMVEINRYSIRYINSKLYKIVIATEMIGNKTGLIQIAVLDTQRLGSINLFIQNNIKVNSGLICKADWQGSNILFMGGYNRIKRSDEYTYPYTNRVLNHFIGWLSRQAKTVPIEKSIEIYCSLVNSLIADISFEELMKNVINKKNPTPEMLDRLKEFKRK